MNVRRCVLFGTFSSFVLCICHIAGAQKKMTVAKHHVTQQATVKSAAVEDSDGYPNPFIGMPFKGGDIITQQIVINVGKIPIRGKITYQIYDDFDGRVYQWRSTYRISIIKLKIDRAKSGNIPNDLIEQFEHIDHSELKAQDIMKKIFPHESFEYLLSVRDFNMDGKPDFAFVNDQGFHSNYVLYDIWVNINNRLVYWQSLSGHDIQEVDKKKRTLQIFSFDISQKKYYSIAKDTTLIPLAPQEE